MMVSLDSARQWYPREEFVACNADHSQIAKLKRGENSIYPSVRWAVKKALLSAGDLYSEAKAVHYGESRDLHSADEASAMRRSLLQVTHHQTSILSDDCKAGLASTKSRPPSEDTINEEIRHLEVDNFANRGDTQPKSNPFNSISQECSGLDVSTRDDIQSSTTPTNSVETDKGSVSFDEDNATSRGTGFTTSLGLEVTTSEEPREDSNPDPARKEDDKNQPPQADDSNVSANGNKSMIMAGVVKSAITEGDEAKTRKLLAYSYDVNCKDGDGMTPLLLAARFKHEKIVRLLLEQGADPRAKCSKAQTTLHWLTMSPRTQITETLIDLLLRYRPPFEVVDGDGRTPLMASCTSGDSLLAERLIRHGADVRAKQNSGKTALYYAAYNGRATMISMLLDYGAELEVRDCQGDTPLHSAVFGPSDSSETVEQLIRAGADKEATSFNTQEDGDSRFRPLHYAIRQRNKACVAYLLESDIDIEAPTRDKWRPLHMAASAGQFQVFKVLLDHGADIEARDNVGRRPLHYAALKGYLEEVKALLDHGADIEARNNDGGRPLHFAVTKHHLPIINVLLDHGADIEARGNEGWGPLHLAALGDQSQVVKALLDHGADIEARGNKWWRPLHVAVRYGQFQISKMLLDHGANPTPKTSRWTGSKPLDLAWANSSASDEQRQAMRALLKEAEKTWKKSGKK